MPIEVKRLVANLAIQKTVLLFGAGSSIPSNAPSVGDLQKHFEKQFGVSASSYSLAEQTAIIEHQTRDRSRLIAELRSRFRGLQPRTALLFCSLVNRWTRRWRSDCASARKTRCVQYQTRRPSRQARQPSKMTCLSAFFMPDAWVFHALLQRRPCTRQGLLRRNAFYSEPKCNSPIPRADR